MSYKQKNKYTMGLINRIKKIYRYVQIACIGNRLRKKIFLKKLLGRANEHWFSFEEKAFDLMCKELALAITGDYSRISNLSFDQFSHYQKRGWYRSNKSKNLRLILIDMLRITPSPSDYNTYKVELISFNLDYDRNNPKSEKYNVRMCYDVTVPFSELEEELVKI